MKKSFFWILAVSGSVSVLSPAAWAADDTAAQPAAGNRDIGQALESRIDRLQTVIDNEANNIESLQDDFLRFQKIKEKLIKQVEDKDQMIADLKSQLRDKSGQAADAAPADYKQRIEYLSSQTVAKDDRIAELESKIARLEKISAQSADKDEQIFGLEAKITRLEKNNAKTVQLQDDLDQANQRIVELGRAKGVQEDQGQIDKLKAQLKDKAVETAELQEKIDEYNSSQSRLRGQLSEANDKIEELLSAQKSDRGDDAAKDLKIQLDKKNRIISELELTIDDYKTAETRLKSQLKETERKLSQSQDSRSGGDKDSRIKNLESQLKKNEAVVSALENELDGARFKAAQSAREVGQVNNELSLTQRKLDNAEKELAKARVQSGTPDKTESLTRKELAQSQDQVENYRQTVQELRDKLAEVQSKINQSKSSGSPLAFGDEPVMTVSEHNQRTQELRDELDNKVKMYSQLEDNMRKKVAGEIGGQDYLVKEIELKDKEIDRLRNVILKAIARLDKLTLPTAYPE